MQILCVSGYAAWNKVSQHKMPSHHLFGVHELIDHYEEHGEGEIRGILKNDAFHEGGYVDFFLWKVGKKNIVSQVIELLQKSKNYDLIYDQLNRCSIYLGFLRKIGMLKCKLLTIMHHPPYDVQLRVSDSDGYIFFNEDYRKLAETVCPKKKNKYFVNEWMPDIEWYDKIPASENFATDAFYIDNGKSRRDRKTLIAAAEMAKIRVDYAGIVNETEGYARAYSVDLKDDVGMVSRLRKYSAVIVPVLENKKYKIGPLGVTSFLDCIALNLPVIASDNVCFAEEIKKYGLGVVYKTGEVESLVIALNDVKKNCSLYRKNMEEYKKDKGMHIYANNLKSIINILRGVEREKR